MISVVLGFLAIGPAVHAQPVDFRLGSQVVQSRSVTTATLGSGPLPLAPGPDATGSPQPDEPDDQEAPEAPHPRFFTAHGFGQGVPLAFAVRQVVPPHVRVTYGQGVDQQQPVSWTGGKPWDQVLRSAVRPLGLHLVMSHMAVAIVE